MATILLCGVDLFFRGKLEALLPGHHFVTSDSADWPDIATTKDAASASVASAVRFIRLSMGARGLGYSDQRCRGLKY